MIVKKKWFSSNKTESLVPCSTTDQLTDGNLRNTVDAKLEAEAQFCHGCGIRVASATCSCGCQLPEQSKFCGRCGKPVGSEQNTVDAKEKRDSMAVTGFSSDACADNTIQRPNNHKPVFIVESLISAGPRKLSPDEYKFSGSSADLCEDSAGLVCFGHKSFFWLADGASDGLVMLETIRPDEGVSNEEPSTLSDAHILSSRVLSQDLGRVFSELVVTGCFRDEIFFASETFAATFRTKIEQLWKQRIDRFITVNELTVQSLFSNFPVTGAGDIRITWSSTFLCGVFDSSENKLDVLNCGDCSGFSVGSNQEIYKIKGNNNRIFVSCTITRDLDELNTSVAVKLDISPNILFSHLAIDGFVFSTDGFDKGGICESAILLESAKHRVTDYLKFMRDLVSNKKVKTYDDRAVIIGRFIK